MKTLKELVRGQVHFKYYRDNSLWYSTVCGFIFPVPLSDTGEATFNAEDKALLFMRWIRKYRDECEEQWLLARAKVEEESSGTGVGGRLAPKL